jgi:hypothetical protein
MKLVEMNWNPTDRQLRQFALICLVALPLLGWLWHGTAPVVAILAGIGLLLAAIGTRFPSAVKPLFVGLTLVALPIGLVIGELAMLLVFFGVFLPIGIVIRIMQRDNLQLRLDRSATTYWQPKSSPVTVRSYYRQF